MSLINGIPPWLTLLAAIVGLVGGLIGIAGGGIALWDRFIPPKIQIHGAVPVFVWDIEQREIAGEKSTLPLRGAGFIVRLQAESRPVTINAADIVGRLYLTGNDWLVYGGEDGKPLKEILEEQASLRPHYKVNWTGWISDSRTPIRLEAFEERYIRFTFKEPTFVTKGRRIDEEYIGFASRSKEPVKIRSYIDWFDFFKVGVDAKKSSFQPAGLRDEFRNGDLVVSVRAASGDKVISPEKIQSLKPIKIEEWQEQPVEYLYHDSEF